MPRSNSRNPRVYVTISEGHYKKLLDYCEAFNFAPAQAAALLLQNAVDEIHEKENLGSSKDSSATRVYYDAMFGKVDKNEVDFEEVAQELGTSIEELEARFEQVVAAQNPFPKRRKNHDCNKQEECECES